MAFFNNPVIVDLLAKHRPIAAMTYSSSLLGWDLEINMPEAGAAARGKAQAELELLRQKMTLDLASLVDKAEKQPLEDVDYDVPAMKQVNEKLLSLLGMPMNRFRLDVSTHPFSTRIAGDDVRITTRYEPKNFKAPIFGLIHECGHALYELQVDRELDFTPIGGGVSSGIHESQSRFWENTVGRSRQFVSISYPPLKRSLSFLSLYEEDQLYYYINSVRLSLIRVEADELTYNFHIAMRYELEKKLLEGTISVSEYQTVWDDMIEDYIGKRPRNSAEGVLQDIHWSWGQYATFPSYS